MVSAVKLDDLLTYRARRREAQYRALLETTVDDYGLDETPEAIAEDLRRVRADVAAQRRARASHRGAGPSGLFVGGSSGQTVRPLVVRRRNRCWDVVPRMLLSGEHLTIRTLDVQTWRRPQ